MAWQNIVGAVLLILGIVFFNGNPFIAFLCLICSIVFLAWGIKSQRRSNGQATQKKRREKDSSEKKYEYVMNPNTMIFHRQNCPHAKKTDMFNKHYYSNRSAMIAAGYKPCKHCKP